MADGEGTRGIPQSSSISESEEVLQTAKVHATLRLLSIGTPTSTTPL